MAEARRRVAHLIIGGGVAAATCALTLRREGAEGEIVMVSRERDLPYDRTVCSKGYLRGREARQDVLLEPERAYREQHIELQDRVAVMKLDLQGRTARLSNKQELEFGQLLLATGAGVRRLNVKGAELEGIHLLRTLGNADHLREDAAGRRVVVVGGSYLGCEVAASLTLLGCQCAVTMLEPVTLSRGFGERAGRFFQERLEEHGVIVHGGEELERFEGAGGRVSRAVLRSGRTLEADAVVVAAGAVPDVMLARGAGLGLGESGGVRVDERLQSEVPGVFAAGDMAEYRSVLHGRSLRVEHWDVAQNQGRVAALNMLGQERDYDVLPYFFSDIADWASLEYVGPAASWDREVVRGSFDEGGFSVWYLDGARVVAALAVGRSADLDHARRLISTGAPLDDPEAQLGDVRRELPA